MALPPFPVRQRDRTAGKSPEERFVRFYPTMLALAFWSASVAAECKDWAARLVTAQGRVEMQAASQGAWLPAEAGQNVCPGDRIRTLKQSRASLQLANQTYLSLDQSTVVVFSHVEADKPSWIELLTGSLFARSRTPKSLDIRTPFINAAIKGTEFMVTVGSGKGEVTVFEGEVEASNAAGQVTVTGGHTAFAASGEAPRTELALRPEDAVQWALYFPPLLDYAALRRETDNPALSEAARLYVAGQLHEALDTLDRVPATDRDAEYTAVRASLLMSVGRVDEAEPLLAAYTGPRRAPAIIDALRSVIALARNRKTEALAFADTALRTDPESAAAWIARSYALQAAFDLDQALEAADRAAALNPDNALVQAHRAELLASLDRWTEARRVVERATQLGPHQSRPWVVKGFAELRDNDVAEAQASFRKAAGLDPADPMARLGLGLAAIRRGDLPEGTADLEMAASLDPGDSLIRSYLGKAYYEQKRNAVSEKQFELAEKFDPKDPTPWFYDAIKKQTENRPVEALHGLQKAMELNGNRAVYRSKLALDEDLAARGAALGRIYSLLGFQPRALVEGWKAVAEDPTDYTAHRLLSDSYWALPGQDIARRSELLQSQLLQPINITPVQPRLAEGNALILGGLGPADLSLNEFNPLFQRNRFGLLASGLVGNNGTYSDEVVHSGLWDDFSYSLGQFHYQTEGYRRNNDIDENLYTAYVQGRITPELNLQAEYRHHERETGSQSWFFAPNPFLESVLANARGRTESDTYRFGMHVTPSAHSDLLGSFIHIDQSASNRSFPIDPPTLDSHEGNSGEVQYIQRHEQIKTLLGGGYYAVERNTRILDSGYRDRNEQGFGYLYSHIRYPEAVTWTVGVSADFYDYESGFLGADAVQRFRTVNPKFGVLWNVTPDTVVRGAGFRTLKRTLITDQTLEPTQIAGFNQFFDDLNGTDATRWGIGLDHRFDPDLAGGAEISRRDLQVPAIDLPAVNRREWLYRGYLLWTPHPRWAGTLEYFRENFHNAADFGPLDTETQTLPASVSYFDPAGWYAKFRASYFYQKAYLGTGPDSDDAVFLDLALGYRLPQRYGIFEVQLQNLLDQNYRYEGPQNRMTNKLDGTTPGLPFPPEFTISARFTLAL